MVNRLILRFPKQKSFNLNQSHCDYWSVHLFLYVPNTHNKHLYIGMYRCGPAPVEAVRRGEVNIGFDTTFVYTEVRADMCVFKESEEGFWTRVKTIPN